MVERQHDELTRKGTMNTYYWVIPVGMRGTASEWRNVETNRVVN